MYSIRTGYTYAALAIEATATIPPILKPMAWNTRMLDAPNTSAGTQRTGIELEHLDTLPLGYCGESRIPTTRNKLIANKRAQFIGLSKIQSIGN